MSQNAPGGQGSAAGGGPAAAPSPSGGPPAVIDLTATDANLPLTAEPSPLQPGRVYDPSRTREWMRGVLALVLIGLLAVVILVPVVALFCRCATSDDVIRTVQLLLAPIVGLVGAVTGFYYGTRDSR